MAAGNDSGVTAGDGSLLDVDASSRAHWQICGQHIGVEPSLDQQCLNYDHMPNTVQ
jgi:hypothetical protein